MLKKHKGTDQLITEIVRGIEEIKGQDIEILDLREIENTVCDYFVICNGTSNTQVNAIVNSVQKTVSKAIQEKPWHVEGSNNAEWVLLDYVHVVVHVFQKQIREFYNIEGLWGDATSLKIETSTKKEEA
ncbi:MAG: ribosome silencing factor [Flavobacteriaceae bacterium]|nr:ribosome silencing factor [Polaribacter sp.]MDG1327072.1 ribosome silencing factor [Flavobacteriaceae bacterium]MDG1790882.1 ribosome silencing factor [Flavobacteriaceae bacterium]